jgi:hypothetical protein
MSEQLPQQNYESPKLKVEELAGQREAEIDAKSAEHKQSLDAERARKAVVETNRSDTRPNPLEKLAGDEKASQAPSPSYINRELKQITLHCELKAIRRKLPAPQRALSRIIHQPAVRAASEAAGKTVSRPSGLLGGGLVALLGTSGYLYLARHIGFQYNYGVFLALFAGGFAFGLIVELAVSLAFRRPQE